MTINYFGTSTILFHYCIDLTLKNGESLHYIDSVKDISIKGKFYSAKEGFSVKRLVTNEGGEDYMEIELLKDYFVASEQLLDAEARIMLYFPARSSFNHYYTMNVTYITDNDKHIILKLEPITAKLQKTLLCTYSQTCRAEFGDSKCKLIKDNFINSFNVKLIEGYKIILTDYKTENGYYTAGDAIFSDGTIIKILNHNNVTLRLDRPVPLHLKSSKIIQLIPGCDKKFTTCCNKFNNAINFRGEPCIPGNKILNII